jgi:NAD(P)-dependent dehydrogenase (short-subunit alcohol dehydrogenase family)
MCERGWGRVITISSGAGMNGLGIGVSLYAAGKGAAISFMRHLAVECAHDGVTANTLALGLMQRDGEPDGSSVTQSMARTIPVGRLGTGEDIGYACVYLASNEASWITGQTIAINGGSTTS